MTLARTFRSRKAAEDHRDLVVAKFKLPRHYSSVDLDDGTIVEVGSGRHVPPSEIVREPVPELKYHKGSDSWVVESSESEEADEELASTLEELPILELLEPDEAPKARGGKGLVRNKETGELEKDEMKVAPKVKRNKNN